MISRGYPWLWDFSAAHPIKITQPARPKWRHPVVSGSEALPRKIAPVSWGPCAPKSWRWGQKPLGKSMEKLENQWKFYGKLENWLKIQWKIYGRIGKSMENLENRWTINRTIALKSFLKVNNRRTINGKMGKPMENHGKMCGSLEERFYMSLWIHQHIVSGT